MKNQFIIENVKGVDTNILTKRTMLYKEQFIKEATAKKVEKNDVDLQDYKNVTRVEITETAERVFFKDELLITFYPGKIVQRGLVFDISNSYEIH